MCLAWGSNNIGEPKLKEWVSMPSAFGMEHFWVISPSKPGTLSFTDQSVNMLEKSNPNVKFSNEWV